MMILIVVVALPLGWKVRRAATQRRAVATVVALGGEITYEDQIDPLGRPRLPHRPWGPAWLRNFLGDEFFQEVAWVHFNSRPQGRMVDDATIAVLNDFDQLQGLNLQGQPGMSREAPPDRFITAKGLARLGSLPRLRSLGMDFIGCDAAMIGLLSRWPTLEHLTIFDLARTIPVSSLTALARLPRLQFVRINAIEAGGAGDLAPLAALSDLKHLSINRSPTSDVALGRLAAPSSPQFVELLGTELTAETLAAWGRRPALEVLRFDGSRLARGDLRALAGQSRLTKLSIVLDGHADGSSTDYPVHRTAPLFGDEDLDALRAVPLDQLAIMGLDATDAGVERLLQTHSFTSLVLTGRGVTDASIPRLVRQTKLYALAVADTAVTDAGLARLATLAGLETLSLIDNPGLSDAGLAALPTFPALKNLTIRQPALRPATLEALDQPRPGLGRLNIFQPPAEASR